MPYTSASAIEIDKKLRDDFRRRIKDFGVPAETVDPVLAVLFRTFAQQLETLYAETGRMRLALLDELIAGLGIERRSPRAAQTVVRLISPAASQLIEAGTDLIGEAESGERLSFRTDAAINISGARLAFAATYQNGALQLLGNLDMPEQFQNARPFLEPVRVNLGPNPSIYLAIQDLPLEHLASAGIYFELGPDALRLRSALEHEPWCLAGFAGELASDGVLRPLPLNAGVRSLTWLTGQTTPAPSENSPLTAGASAASLPAGFYGSRNFVFPSIPKRRRFVCSMPRGMDVVLSKIFGRDATAVFSEPRAWLRIGLPSDVTDLHTSIGGIMLHCVTASNVQCLNQTIYFDQHGTSIPVGGESDPPSQLVAPLSITGESGADYLPDSIASSDPGAGRYSIRNGRVELRPARRGDASCEAYTNLRAWVTNGAAGNRVGPGRIQSFLSKGSYSGVTLINPTGAAGGSDGESVEEAQKRFAEALLSRDRIVTRDDMKTAVKALDRRVIETRVVSELHRGSSGLRRTEQVRIRLNRSDFVDPEVEGQILAEDLSRSLQARSLYDTELRLQVEWT